MATIVVATDFSDASEEALAQALRLAKDLGADVELVCVVPRQQPLFPHDPANVEAVAALEERETEEATRALEKSAGRAAVSVHRSVLRGQPAEEIIAHAERKRARFIVLGSRGRSLASAFLLGSTTDRVLRRSAIPVLVVPPKERKG